MITCYECVYGFMKLDMIAKSGPAPRSLYATRIGPPEDGSMCVCVCVCVFESVCCSMLFVRQDRCRKARVLPATTAYFRDQSR